MSVTNTFHIVEELPHNASVLMVDECGSIHTYLSRAVGLETVAADLSWVFTTAAQTGDYARRAG